MENRRDVNRNNLAPNENSKQPDDLRDNNPESQLSNQSKEENTKKTRLDLDTPSHVLNLLSLLPSANRVFWRPFRGDIFQNNTPLLQPHPTTHHLGAMSTLLGTERSQHLHCKPLSSKVQTKSHSLFQPISFLISGLAKLQSTVKNGLQRNIIFKDANTVTAISTL